MREDKKRNTDIVHNILCPFRCREPHVCAALDGWDLCSMLSEKSIWGSLLPPEPHLPSHPARCRTRAMLVRVTPMSAMPRERTKTVNTNQVTASSIQTRQTPFFYCECSQTLEEVVQRGCWVSVLGDAWNLSGSMQPELAEPDLRRGVGLDHLQRSFPTIPYSLSPWTRVIDHL